MTFTFTFIVPVISFMYGIYNYVPETNNVCRVYSVIAVLYLQFVLHEMFFPQCHMCCVIIIIIIIIIIAGTIIIIVTALQ